VGLTPALESVELGALIAGSLARGPCVVALGSFDGVHRGHVALLEQATLLAHSSGQHSVALTFDRLPRELLEPESAPPLLTSHARRQQLLAGHVDRVVVAEFNSDLAALGAQDFVEGVLWRGLQCRQVVVGFNYTFGRGAAGSVETLRDLGRPLGLTVYSVPPVLASMGQVSSTLIRNLVARGEVAEAAGLLGRPFALDGTVVPGMARGRRLGFPTANLEFGSRMALPAEGVYLSQVWLPLRECLAGNAVTAVSRRPTFGDHEPTVESYILDYSGDLYGQQVQVRFLQRLRGIIRFSQPEELRTQMERDVRLAREYFHPARLQA
jgi:riboflavin kinase/FMN adenylyltransferase